MALSESLGLIATAAADGTLRVWDLQFMNLDGDAGRVPYTPPPPPPPAALPPTPDTPQTPGGGRVGGGGGGGGAGGLGRLSRRGSKNKPGKGGGGEQQLSYKERRARARAERAAKAAEAALHEATGLAAPMRRKLTLVAATALCFVEPYPLLAVGDSEGFLSFCRFPRKREEPATNKAATLSLSLSLSLSSCITNQCRLLPTGCAARSRGPRWIRDCLLSF